MDLKHLHSIRDREIDQIITWFPERARILEIGAGSGRQAQRMSEHGFRVEAIDLAGSRYADQRVWSVTDYDGQRIPFPDESFDVVFSSSVLEHIPHVVEFQQEIQRVLEPDGIAVHVVPNSGWRVWSNIAHYLFLARLAASAAIGGTSSDGLSARIERGGLGETIRNALSPSRHGELGNAWSEAFYFTRFRWDNLFESTGWKIVGRYPNRLFYTGYAVLGQTLSIRSRRALSRLFGSVCHVYILRR